MTEILCNWLNNDVKLSKKIDKSNIARDFSTGYLFGEIFNHFLLQDDFGSFSAGQSSNAKLNNFIQLEPTFNLLEIPFDANIAYDVMTQKYGVATRLLYQMFISLQRKEKNNLTGAAMQTMRPSAPVKLEMIESGLYKERLKTLIPRESDLTLHQVSSKFERKRDENEKRAIAQKYKQHMEYEAIKQEQRKMALEKSRLSRLQQTELLAKIQAATVHIPKPPPSKTLQAIKHRQEVRRKREAESTHFSIRSFEDNLKKLVAPAAAAQSGDAIDEEIVGGSGGFEYLDRIKTRLSEERSAREERAKRRRKVLVDQMKAHHAQEEAHRQEQIVQRLMRQSQMERRVAVQLMQVRSEKDNIRKNRIFREKQYEERRLKDFQDALDLEAKLAKLAREEYEENAAQEKELHNRNMARKRQERYKKHYDVCKNILFGIIDFSSKIIEYRDLTEKKVPEKLVREWKELFLEGQPIYEEQEDTRDAEVQARREEILNSQDFAEYKNMLGEWKPDEAADFQNPPASKILGHILHRMFNMVHPPEAPPPAPKFPDFPIQAAIVGKMFAGKSSILEQLERTHNIAHLSVDKLLSSAIEAFRAKELEPVSLDAVESVPATVNVEPPTPRTGENRGSLEVDENLKDSGVEKENKERGLSERAKLGEKASKYLEVGEAVPDSVLVDVIANEIHNIPEGRGWILDGFPTNVQQAVLLEKAITGNDVSPVAAPIKKKLSKTSSLVSDPKPTPQAIIGTTALDVVLILDVSDEMVLKRALGRTYERKEDQMFHEEFSPAPLGSRTGIGNAEKVVSVEDKAFDKDQVQHRIMTFHDNWKKLEGFYSKLSMIQHVDGEQAKTLTYEDAEKALFQTLEKVKNKGKEEPPIEKEEIEEEPKEEPPPKAEPPEGSRASSPTSKTSKAPSPSGSRKGKSPKERGKSAEKGGKSRSRSGSRKGSAKSKKSRSRTPTPTPQPEEVQGPPPPKPGEPDWNYVDELLPMECARIAVPMWDNTESTFKNTCMHIFHQIRVEREGIIRYIYQSRSDFRQHLRRPDPKQAFVDAWQKDFNEIPDDIREDEETKAEMHQRLYDLRERLWDICDTKKEEAEAERAELMRDGWLEDHLGLLINQYLSLMQTEIDRFQSTNRLLKDYYTGMQKKIPNEDATSDVRLPLVELDVDEPVNPTSSNETMGSDGQPPQESSSETKKNKKGKEEEAEAVSGEGHIKIPLIQRGATFSLQADEGGKGKKGKGPDPGTDTQLGEGELEEKTIVDGYNAAVNYLANLVQADIAAKEAEIEEERRLKEEEEKAKMAQNAPADKKGGGKKKSAKGKKGAKSKSPTPTPPTPVNEMSEEDKRKLEIASNMREEYIASLKEEENRIKCNLMLIRYRAILTLSELKEAMSTSYAEMLEWLGARYLAEMKSIEQLTDAGQHAIEGGIKLKYQVCLNQDEFVINLELRVARTPSPPPVPAPIEIPMPETFTVVQLTHLLHQFRKVSPTGTIANKSFTELLSDSALLTYGLDALPESWLTVTYTQLVELCNLISPECEYVDWRKFLLIVSKPWTVPTIENLLSAQSAFQSVDVAENGWITEDQYTQVKTWLCDAFQDEEANEMTYPRMKNLHQFFFLMFADWEQSPPRLDYVNMLMYFAMDLDAVQGYMRALSVASNQLFPKVYKTVNPPSASSKTAETEDSVSENLPVSNICVTSEAVPKPLISVQAWWLVMHHGSSRLSDSHRFSITDDPDDKFSLQRLQSVYTSLDAENFAPQTLQLLLQHPLIQDAILSTNRYRLPDISSIFDKSSVQIVDGEDAQSVQASIG
uniref:sperm flagellar protein 2-like n=1 Tax=Styela clava TaxID=7725 RepID=UPI00193A5E3F|nr:sperm flagellar protein 2-like [Styela clava]